MQALSPAHKAFGNRVKELRTNRGMTQEALADAVNVDRSYMGFVERGERNPTLEKIIKIAEALKVKPSDLLTTIP